MLLRFGMLLAVAACATLVWWSVSRRLLPATRELRDQTVAMTRLAREVEELEKNWNEEEVQRTEERYKQAQELLFNSDADLLDWKEETEREAVAMNLAATTQTNQARPHATESTLALRPVNVRIDPVPVIRTTNSPYRRFLGLAETLQKQAKRVDLLELSVTGNSNSLQRANLTLEAWASAGKAAP